DGTGAHRSESAVQPAKTTSSPSATPPSRFGRTRPPASSAPASTSAASSAYGSQSCASIEPYVFHARAHATPTRTKTGKSRGRSSETLRSGYADGAARLDRRTRGPEPGRAAVAAGG